MTRLSVHGQKNEEGSFETDCKNEFEFFADGPEKNKFKFCPYCGRTMQGQEAPGEVNEWTPPPGPKTQLLSEKELAAIYNNGK